MMASAIEHFTHGGPVRVDVGAIENDLASLWRMASATNTAVTRACSWNLVVHAMGDAELARARSLAESLVSAVPSRTLVLNHRPSEAGTELEAFVTANCRMMPGGGKLVCAEEITVEARGAGGEHLPSLVRALLVPDIPTAVLWADLPPASAVVAQLIAGVERIVLDTSRAETLAPVERLGAPATARVVDLNWLRLASLRLAVAAAFDAPEDPSMLFRLSRVTVGAPQEALSAAKLLLGWLGTQLAWGPPRRVGGPLHRWLSSSREADVSIAIEVEDGTRLNWLAFEANDERVELGLSDGEARIESKMGLRATPFALRSDGELVVAALGSRGNDELYRGALGWAVELER